MDWIGEETGDDPLLPGTVSSLISDFRAHEIDMIDQDEYRYLEGSPVFTSALCPKSRLTRREIRIELAVRARGKWLDYAGQWWPESAFTWVGYLIALYDAGILNERDTRYLFRRLPKEYQQFFEQAIPPGTEEPALIFTGLRSQQSDASS